MDRDPCRSRTLSRGSQLFTCQRWGLQVILKIICRPGHVAGESLTARSTGSSRSPKHFLHFPLKPFNHSSLCTARFPGISVRPLQAAWRHPDRARPDRRSGDPGRRSLPSEPPAGRSARRPKRRTGRTHVVEHHNQLNVRYTNGSIEERPRNVLFADRRGERRLRGGVPPADGPPKPARHNLRHPASKHQAVVHAASKPPPPRRRHRNEQHTLGRHLEPCQLGSKLTAKQPPQLHPHRPPRGELEFEDRVTQQAVVSADAHEVRPRQSLVATPRASRQVTTGTKLRLILRRTRAAPRAVICG